MYSRKSAAQLAARVKSLIGPVDRATIQRVAWDLGVHVGDLREIVEYQTRYPSVVVLAAIVDAYGVDAGWLLTGQYSPSTHRADEELEAPGKWRVIRLLEDLEGRQNAD
jgi:hypothetical protein